MSEIDTEVRYVTKAGANLFVELGFPPEEAARYQQETRDQIERMNLLKVQLMDEVAHWIRQNNLRQEDAAKILHVSRPRVSDIVNRKVSNFSVDALIGILALAGKPVRLVVG